MRVFVLWLILQPVLFYTAELKASVISTNTQFSLLTASPGTELYSVFGHSALRVYDPIAGIDEVYNYGTFDFDTPNFYFKFMRGKLLYQLSVTTMKQFLWVYEYEQRAIYEQVLSLTQEEKQRIYDFLQVNRLPENRSYLYDFFYDNCATRIRDLADGYLYLDWGEDPFPGPPRSFRDLLKPYLANKPWARFGIDIALGLPADKIAAPWHYMFLPDEMFVAFAHARHVDGRPLVSDTTTVLTETQPMPSRHLISPLVFCWMLFAAGLLSLLIRKVSFWFDKIYFSVLGLAGLLMLVLWFLSDHTSTNYNLNLLWALPTHLYFIFRIGKYRPGIKAWAGSRMVQYYFMVTTLISFLLLILWNHIPQAYHEAFVPLIALSGMKALRIVYG